MAHRFLLKVIFNGKGWAVLSENVPLLWWLHVLLFFFCLQKTKFFCRSFFFLCESAALVLVDEILSPFFLAVTSKPLREGDWVSSGVFMVLAANPRKTSQLACSAGVEAACMLIFLSSRNSFLLEKWIWSNKTYAQPSGVLKLQRFNWLRGQFLPTFTWPSMALGSDTAVGADQRNAVVNFSCCVRQTAPNTWSTWFKTHDWMYFFVVVSWGHL